MPAVSHDIWGRYCTLTKQAQNKLAATTTKMENKIMLNIAYTHIATNLWVKDRAKFIDKISSVKNMN